MSLTFSTADAVLKEDYKDPLREQLNQAHFILSQIEKNTDDVVGLRAYLAIHTARSGGIGARGENGTLPTARNQGYAEAHIPMRFNYGRIQISGPIIRAMSADRGTFIRAVKSETDGIAKDLKRDVNRQIWGTSDGAIATCGVTSSATTVVMDSATTSVQYKQIFNEGGMYVDIGTVADPDLRNGTTARLIETFDESAGTVEISGAAITTAATDFIFRYDAGGASDASGLSGDGQFELTGLQTIVDSTGTLFGVNPTNDLAWVSGENSNSGTNRAITEQMVNKEIQKTEIRSGEQVDLLVCSDGVSRSVSAMLESIRRNVDNVSLKAGYSGIAWATPMEGNAGSKTRALCWDQDCPSNSLYGLSTDSLVEFVMSDWDWMDEDGAVLSRVANTDAYEATMFKYHELASGQRNAHFKILDITES
jgi:hypothetical protein